jgi:polysaccharide biosynthesis transport protein
MNGLVLRGSGPRLIVAENEVQQRDGLPWLRHAVGVLRCRWRLAATVAAMTLGVVAIIGLLMPHTQYAEATLVIHPVSDNLAEPVQQPSSLPPDTSAIDTEVEILRSPAVALSVVKNLRLYKDPEFGGSPKARPTDALMRTVMSAVEAGSRIRRIGLTYVVQVGFLASSAEKAKWIADGIVNAYMARKMDEKLEAVARANHDLGSTLGALREQALQAQAHVEDYEAKYNLVGDNGTSLMESELSALNQQIADAQADAAEKNARLGSALAQARDGSGGSDVGATLASNTIGALRQREADASATLSQLQTEFRPDYPAVQKATAQLDDIRRQLSLETSRILSSLRADAQVASRRESSLLTSRQQIASVLASNNRARAGLLTLQQDADTAKKIYETYLTRASEVSAARSLQEVDATVESRAISVPGSFLTSWRFIGAVAALLAILAALTAVMLSETWNRRIRSWTDVTRETGAPLAATLPDVTSLRQIENPASHFANHPQTIGAEAFRNLRAFLAISAQHAKIVAVTSSVPGEGKTFTSVRLARAMAATGSRVMLLDADIRRASASRYFEKPTFGMAEVVEKSIPLDQALVRDPESGVWFLKGAATREISGDIFGSNRIDAFLAKLSTQFDKVVIDTSPILGFADARILASKADCVLHVVHWDKTPTSMIHGAMEILRQSNARLAGIVLNKVDLRQQARYGFADASGYYHYYGSSYAQPAA